MTTQTAIKVGKSLCNLCPTRCGLNISVANTEIVKTEGNPDHPFHQLCVKGQAVKDWVDNPDRVTEPMRKVKGKWQAVSWDDALDYIAGKLKNIKEKYGARSLVVHIGYPFVGFAAGKLIHRFCDAYESPNFTTGASLCYWARGIAQSLTFNHDTEPLAPNFRGSRCIIVWGINPAESAVMQAAAITASRKEGAKLIVIDPRVTPFARQANIHARIRPGTDTALALGMLNVIIGEGLYDKEFVSRWTYGFDRLAEHVKQYPPEKVADITWVPADIIRSMARLYATSRPACITQGVALDHCTNGIQTTRAICSLMAICGNYDVDGGNTFSRRLAYNDLRLNKDITGEIGASYPLFTKFLHESSSAPVTNAILTGKPYPVKAVIFSGANAMATWPETPKLKRAMANLELSVVMDMVMNDTARLADVFLPAASCVESELMRDYAPTGAPMIVLTQPVIEPRGNSWSDAKFWLALAKRMGYAEQFPWHTDEEFYAALLEPTGVTVEQLKQKPGGIFHHKKGERRYLTEGFHTPSGKAELYSDLMAQCGYDPLPTYHEPPESPVSQPRLARQYPLILISGPRVLVYIHSQLRNSPAMRKRHPEPLAQLHPETAHRLGIADGDTVSIETKRGSVEMKAQLTGDILPQVVCIPHGWSGKANANLLTSDDTLDPISGFPAFKSMLCRVRKAE